MRRVLPVSGRVLLEAVAAMSELQDRMETVGWHNQDDQRDYNYAVFRWMDEATREIEALRREVESLSRVVTQLSNLHP